ncbi:helix-turn-helix domain-containing protein [Ruminococcaceae bacterium OttesenSCG-928-L11]|nr:helix-turn-helix domain-containing protein [Ruminococcaceae bacterium OttesenSCG-928-L11]
MKKHKVFFRYLCSYLFVLCIPLIILGAIIQTHYTQTYRDSIMNEKILRTRQLKMTLDMQMQQINAFGNQVSYNELFSPYNVRDNIAVFPDIARELRYFLHFNPNVSEVIYHLLGDDQYYLSKGTLNKAFIFTDVFRYDEIGDVEDDGFFGDLHRPVWLRSQHIWRSAVGGGNVVTYVMPLAANKSVMLFQLPAGFFEKLFSNDDWSKGTATLLLCDGDVIVSHNPEGLALSDLDRFLAGAVPGELTSVEADGAYWLFQTEVSDSNFTILEIIPEAVILTKLSVISRIYGICIVCITMIGAVAIYIGIRANYTPLKRLGKAARGGLIAIPEELNLLESVEFAMENYMSQVASRPESDVEAMREARLFGLLRGQYATIDDFNEEARGLSLFIPAPGFRVVVLTMGDEPLGDPRLFEQIREIMQVEHDLFMLAHLEQNSFIWIMLCPEDNEADLKKRLWIIQHHYLEVTGRHLTIGVGGRYLDPTEIPASYAEARKAVKYRIVRGNHSIIFFDEVSREEGQASYQYPKAELDGLYYAIVHGNPVRIEFAIQSMIELMRQDGRSLFLSMCLCYDVVNTALRAMHDLSKEVVTPPRFDSISAMTELRSIDEFNRLMEAICAEILAWLEENHKKSQSLDINGVIAYIQQHHADSDFSVSSLADHFQMSISNFSHQFKALMNRNVSTYINEIRLETAKTLLASTDLPVNDIAGQLGYVQPSSFIRSFKKALGMTPGEYRSEAARETKGAALQ